jgi:hypothetical protein
VDAEWRFHHVWGWELEIEHAGGGRDWLVDLEADTPLTELYFHQGWTYFFKGITQRAS